MANDLEEFVHRLGRVPPELRREMRPALRAAGRVVADDARRRAAWSTRIPTAIRVSVSFATRTAGVSVVVDRKKAPHARPYENGGVPGVFRHPVYGNREVWVSQRARPFLYPALLAKGDAAEREISRVVDTVTRQAGFR